MVSATPATTPDPPTITSIDEGNATLSVNYIEGSDGGSAITFYSYSVNNGSSWSSDVAITNPLVITDLSNGTTYNVQVRAKNIKGYSTGSVTVQGTPFTVPSAPTSLIASTGPATGDLQVDFTPGFDGGKPITNYSYSVSTDNSLWSVFTPFSPDTLAVNSVIIMGLTAGESYYVKLKATNDNGMNYGAESAASNQAQAGM